MKHPRNVTSLLLGLVVAAAMLTAGPALEVIAEEPSAPAALDVTAFGAVGDGVTDDTAAFEAAIARGFETKLDVYVPPGRYRITRTLTLAAQTLRGAAAAAWVADDVSAPTLLPEVEEGPFIRMKGGASVHGFHIYYDWKEREPHAIGAAIELAGVGCRVTEVKIFGAWDGIMSDGVNNVGRFHIERCFLVNVHNVGVRATGTWDSSWLSKVEVWSPGSPHFGEKGIGFLFGKNDALIISDCFVFAAHQGYKFQDQIDGCEIEGGTWGTIANCVGDYCGQCIAVEGEHTLSITGGSFWSHLGGLYVGKGDAQVRVTGAELAANGAPALHVDGGQLVTASACQIRRLMEQFEAPALRVSGGQGAVITGCVLQSASEAVEIGESQTETTVVESNLVKEDVKEGEAPGGR